MPERPRHGPPPPNPIGQGGPQPRRYQRGRREPPNLPELKKRKRGILPHQGGPIPETWDSREKGWVPPIKDQGNCGSCWDFSGTGVVEIALIKAGVLKADGSDALSEQFTLDCGDNGGCSGDDNTTVLEWATKKGLPFTRDYGPYQASARECRPYRDKQMVKIQQWGFADGGQGDGVTGREAIQRAIMACGSVGSAVAAGQDWDEYDGDEFWGTGSHGIDHDVILLGWKPSRHRPGKVCWLLRNSWGTGWGDGGYMWIGEGADDIGTEAVFAQAQAPDPGPGPGPGPAPPAPAKGCFGEFVTELFSGVLLWTALANLFTCLFHSGQLSAQQRRFLMWHLSRAHESGDQQCANCYCQFLCNLMAGEAFSDCVGALIACLFGNGERGPRHPGKGPTTTSKQRKDGPCECPDPAPPAPDGQRQEAQDGQGEDKADHAQTKDKGQEEAPAREGEQSQGSKDQPPEGGEPTPRPRGPYRRGRNERSDGDSRNE